MSFTHGQSVRLKDNAGMPDIPVDTVGIIVKYPPQFITFMELRDAMSTLGTSSYGEEIVDFTGVNKGVRVVILPEDPTEVLEVVV